jgi:hypothetical protein
MKSVNQGASVIVELATLNAPDQSTFYTPGEKGYTDYPTLETDANSQAHLA